MYFFKRLLLIFPTLFVIMLVNFLIIQTAPGGPVERFVAQMNHAAKVSGEVGNVSLVSDSTLNYQGSQGVDEELIEKVKKLERWVPYELSKSNCRL